MSMNTGRRNVMIGMAGALAAAPLARAFGADPLPPLPKSAVAINVIDIAGNLALTQAALEKYRKDKPNLVSRITFTKAPAPELAGKLKAQQHASRTDIDLVLTGIDGMAAGLEQNLYVPVLEYVQGKMPNLMDSYLAGCAEDAGPGGEPRRVSSVLHAVGPGHRVQCRQGEDRADDGGRSAGLVQGQPQPLPLCAAGQLRPGRASSSMGLPYVAGRQATRKDPIKGWDKTWAYLKELGQYIEYYPSGTGPVMKELGEGSRDMVPSHVRAGTSTRARWALCRRRWRSPSSRGSTLVLDAHYLCDPQGRVAGKAGGAGRPDGFHAAAKEQQADHL